jgi:DNA-binding XRE family transcriptional regulator
MAMVSTKTLEERFLEKAMPEPNSGCWLWTSTRRRDGYGIISAGKRGNGILAAHRVSYNLFCSEIPDGLYVLHKCDNKACVNPEHLFLGTHQDNMADMSRKVRASRHNAKLSAEQLNDVRIRLANGEKQKDIAARYGISRQAVGFIAAGKNYRSVA